MSFIKLFIVTLIKCYQATISFRQPVCRFNPTCSHYALEAIDKHGVIHGAWLALKRLVRCHPFSSHGYDPVPVKEEILV